MKNLTDFRKTVETGVDPRLPRFIESQDLEHVRVHQTNTPFQ